MFLAAQSATRFAEFAPTTGSSQNLTTTSLAGPAVRSEVGSRRGLEFTRRTNLLRLRARFVFNFAYLSIQASTTTRRWCTFTWPAVASHFGLRDITACACPFQYLQLHLRVCICRLFFDERRTWDRRTRACLRDLAFADCDVGAGLLHFLCNHEPRTEP